jgi:diguanylate cyclase (GGDEF)-like protein
MNSNALKVFYDQQLHQSRLLSHFRDFLLDGEKPRILMGEIRVKAGSKLWMGVACGLPLLQIIATLFLRRGFALTALSDFVSTALIIMVLLAFARNAILSQGRLRSVWTLQAVGWSLWLADQGAWLCYDVVLRKPMPDLFPGDIVLFLAGVPMLAGFLLRPHLTPSECTLRLGLIDFLQLLLWWIYFYVYLVICWLYVSRNADFYNRNYDQLYAVEIFVQVLVLGVLVKESSGTWRRFYGLFLGAIAFNFVCVAAENSALEAQSYYGGSWYDTPFAASLAAFVIIALKGRDLAPTAESAQDQKYGSWMATLAALAALSLPIIIVATMMSRSGPPEILRFRVLISAMTMFVMASLIFVRQWRLHIQLRRTNEILQEASFTDPLTGIRNRRFFSATVEYEVAQTLRAFVHGQDRSSRDLIFYLVDIDNFKEVNDRFGHDAGDQVLIETARRINSAIRSADVLLRWGGEEFLIVSRQSDRRQAEVLASRVMEAIKGEPFAVDENREIRRTCSIGWAAFPPFEEDLQAFGYEEVLNLADRALIQAKNAGKDRALGLTPPLAAAPLACS